MVMGGADSADFAVSPSGTTCSTTTPIAANGGTCTVSLMFTPSGLGASAGTLTLADSAPNGPQTLSLSGTGIQPSIAITSVNPSALTLVAGGSAQT